VRMARFVPQAELLPHCDLVVHHAGAGTAFGALAHGLPSVAVPQSADNFQIGRRLARAGAARVVMPDEASVTSVREAVAEVLDDLRYAASARQVAAEIAAMPTADEVATVLADGPR
ncbi:MAG TPA: nucleotide disphospho-sugar-binding domain-containing protein, partial [Marmoricola sp.]